MEEVSNWIPTSFSNAGEVERDTLSAFTPETTPTTSNQQADDLSFDLISRQKLSLTPRSVGSSSHDRLSPKGGPVGALFEDDTRSSWSVESSKNTSFKETETPTKSDEDSRSSISSHKSLKRKLTDEEEQPAEENEVVITALPAESLFEYMWPSEKGEFFILQEQISDYLSVKSFKRKYPDLQRRPVEVDEREYLKGKGIVTEMQCDLGLTAIKSEDVMELMNKDYPLKYAEYIQVLRDREKEKSAEKHKETAANVDKNKMVDVVKKAIKSAAEYNAHLNQERKEERRCCIDLQTFTIHYPIGKLKVKRAPKMGKYPVALLPGQFQDSYKDYTPEELKYLPLNTVLYGPMQEIKTALSEGSHSDSEDSTASDGSCSSSQGTHDEGSGESSSGSEKMADKNPPKTLATTTKPVIEKVSIKTPSKKNPPPTCKVCKLSSGKVDKNEPLLQCSVCLNSAHPTCLELTLDMVAVLKTYAWQCMDCKTCVHCRDPYDEDKMLFCDICDRGYHTFCVGLKTLPQGKWICQLCGRCTICNATQAGPDGSKAQWQYDTSKNSTSENASSRQQVVCQTCFKSKNSNA